MNIHEYQGKDIFARYGIPMNQRSLARTAEEAYEIAKTQATPGCLYAVKAQVHAGGRGKGGGVKVFKTPEEARDCAAKLFGTRLVTPQTGKEGRPVESVLIEFTYPIEKEFYVSIVLNRSACQPCLIVSEAGGMNIEEVAQKFPEKMHKTLFPIETGLSSSEGDRIAALLTLTSEQRKSFSKIFQAISKLFIDLDCSLVEINPLAILEGGQVIAIDAKINFDDNALYRHEDMAALRDSHQEDPREVEAKKYDLSYVGLEGNIGCIVNGAGLAMATMDIIKYAGGEPANFLDVGGGAGKEKVASAFKIILKDQHVKAILVNIFGGIMRCDVVAEGILEAVKEIGVTVPIVVRLEGTNVKEGKEILARSNLKVITASTFAEAAEKVVKAVTA
ncbi:MAG: ADP-forming succinate--CoA ligase subunit beta [Candidatus Omnitrophica bacterium]|nr:ADP-forming succinate--CoA ligase subunit beta [Candidatus Omnitrophota bacterium]